MVAQSFLALSLPPVMLFTSFANTGTTVAGCIHSAVTVNIAPAGSPAPRQPTAIRKGSSCTCRACRRPSFRYNCCPLGSRLQGHWPLAQLQRRHDSGHMQSALGAQSSVQGHSHEVSIPEHVQPCTSLRSRACSSYGTILLLTYVKG